MSIHRSWHCCQQFSRHGGRLYVLRGNRDFYLNADFARTIGGELLEEPVPLKLGQQTALLMHGDLLCIKDVGYQRYRRVATAMWTERLFMSLPLPWRRSMVRGLRVRLRTHAARKSAAIVDADAGCVQQRMREYGVHTLIHGHTHRPAVHEFLLDGRAGAAHRIGRLV